jgi:hypothetical protein
VPLTAAERWALLAGRGPRKTSRAIRRCGWQAADALTHWQRIERDTRSGRLSFYEGMWFVAGTGTGADVLGHSLEHGMQSYQRWIETHYR